MQIPWDTSCQGMVSRQCEVGDEPFTRKSTRPRVTVLITQLFRIHSLTLFKSHFHFNVPPIQFNNSSLLKVFLCDEIWRYRVIKRKYAFIIMLNIIGINNQKMKKYPILRNVSNTIEIMWFLIYFSHLVRLPRYDHIG